MTVAAGASTAFSVTFAAPTDIEGAYVPIFSGLIHIESSDSTQSYNVPYAGVAASLTNDYPQLDT